jgi:hypothetical protein
MTSVTGVFDLDWPEIGSPIWCLQITETYGLLLLPSKTDDDVFERKGIFHLRSRGKQRREPKSWFDDDEIRSMRFV